MSNKIKFIINTSVEYFGVNSQTGIALDEQTAAILEFLENDEITVISAVHNKQEDKIKFHHRILNDEVCLLFYKIPQVGKSTYSIDNQPLGILTLEGGLVKSIYNSVSRVFSPHANTRKTEYSPELSGLLENLHVSLGSTLGLPQSGITSIKDEINYWKQKLNNKSSARLDREAAQVFISILENIEQRLSSINSSSANNIEDFLDSSHNNFDELWRLSYQYPQNRMADLMDIIGNQVIEACLEQLITEDIWSLNNSLVNSLMGQCIDTAESWIQLCDSLTRLFWPNYVKHPWMGEAHTPKRAHMFKERMSEIRNIKNLYKQIATLLNDDEMREMITNQSPFRNLNIFDTTAMGQTKWNKALNNFEQLLQPIDERIAAALKAQLHHHLSNPRQVIFIFSKYETLIQRPTVLELLTIEREQFMQSLQILLQDLRKAMTDTNMEPDTGHLSVICNECRWLKVVEYQIQEIEKVSHLISGREGFDKINKAVQEIKEETESLLRTNFEIWCGQHATAVKSGDLRLRDDQPVVKFEKEGRQLMRVTFNPKLVTFCQDVREFENMGYNVPSELRSAATHAAKYMCYARRLQQIATFHNTIGDRMIPCQRPIMLKNAMELSKLVHSETVAWNDEDSVERYVNTLQAAVSKLSADNTLLVGYHEQAKRTVIKLMNTDLFTQSQSWKDEMRHLRELVANLERQGFTNLDAFKLHWDHQLYKVLEYQYIIGLVDMNNKLPDIHIKITFRQRQLIFIPSEEEIRDKYFSQLRRFIERPCGFRGLSDKSSDLFKTMVEINRHYLGPLYEQAEELFSKLDKFKKLWLPWVSLGCVDVEELCGIHLQTSDDWDRNFRKCKHFSQKIAKIQNNEESIDCIVIDILPLRSDIENISRRYWEALSNSLRAAILNDITIIQEFLQNALQFLQNVPMDESSITESGMKYEKIMTELPKVTETLNLVKAKDNCLAGWCKERVTSLASILIQWEKLQPLLENHAVILQRQVDMIKDQAQTQIQNLHNEAEKFIIRWESTIAELEANETATLDMFKERQDHWQEILSKKQQLLEECAKFNMIFPDDLLQPFEEIDGKMKEQSKEWLIYDEYLKELEAIVVEEWSIYRRRPYMLNELITKWEGSIHSSIDLPSKRIRQSVEKLQTNLPILQQLQSDSLTERHWARIFMLLKKEDMKNLHNFSLKDILEDQFLLQQHAGEIAQIVRQASSEQVVRQALTELDQWSVTAKLKLITQNDSSGNSITLIKDYQEVLNKIGDNQSLLQSAKNSAAFEAFSDQAGLWESRLNSLDVILTSLNQSQRRWVYLEPVFEAGTLKNEEALFKRIDKDFRYIMREIEMDPRVISLVKINNITTLVKSLETQLTRCQNNLMSYIMDKRNSFPRFYFLGDDDLLEILGQASKDPEVIQKHIKKLFPGCHALGIKQGTSGDRPIYTIQSVKSSEGDVLNLKAAIEMTGPIESWLNALVTNIQQTLKEQIVQCCNSYPTDGYNENILQNYAIQVLSTTRAIQFTKQAEKAIQTMTLQKLQQQLNTEITKYSTWKHQTHDMLLQMKLRSLLFELVHYVTVVEELIQNNTMHLNDWHWLAQLKFYLGNSSGGVGGGGGGVGKDARTVIVRMVYAEFEYSYEFLGNPNKLVSTRLTHKCYLILTQAMHMGLGGNPFGPAGTGKTECVKALGAMLGRLVLVFNCDENVDTESMGLILTGLARCGAWGCFDEFNRLQEATLSAISMLIQPIQCALKDKSDTVQIAEKNIKLNHHCGIFVTLNPAGADYGGRQKLPGNIQALFRPIVMQQPEPREIARVMLFVEGFKQATEIAERVVELFDMCGKILTHQRHYDWGLRELKTILLACGEGLRENLKNDDNYNNGEMSVVVQCLRASTMSKLTLHDVARFDMLLLNVFPEIKINDKFKSTLQQSITEAFSLLGLCANEMQMIKCLQLYEQLQKRMGVVVMGPPGCGKSTIISVLRQALMQQQIRIHTISPKSMSRIQLLGRLDPDTRQWLDGVLTHTAAAVNAEPPHIHSWIVCDGSIDPEWIEALNSVLDDNKLLTLPSGWRIQFGNNVNFIFETDDVRNASPATISRMGIVNMNNEDYPLKSILEYKLSKFEFGDLLQSYIEEIYEPIMAWLEKEYLHTIPSLTRSRMLRALLLKIHSGHDNNFNIQNREEFTLAACHAAFEFLPVERHNEFANWLYEKADLYVANPNHSELMYFNRSRNMVDVYETDISSGGGSFGGELIETASIKMYLQQLKGFLEAPCSTPFLIVGPAGAAKTLLIEQAVQDMSGYELITINCSTQLTPAYIIHCLRQNCMTVSGVRGREYKAKQTRLVMYLKNLDLCYLDAWGCSEIVELLLQLVQRQGFYNDNSSNSGLNAVKNTGTSGGNAGNNNKNKSNNTSSKLEWINVSGLQICGSISQSTTQTTTAATANASLVKIAPRYLAINHLLHIGYPTQQDMLAVTQRHLEHLVVGNPYHHLQGGGSSNNDAARFKGMSLQNVQSISEGLMEFYAKFQAAFTMARKRGGSASGNSTDATTTAAVCNAHYQFSPKFIMKTLANLKYYPETAFNEALYCELVSMFKDRLACEDDAEKFETILRHSLRKIGSKDKIYFVPKTTKHNAELQTLQHDEWLEEVQKQITICNSESFIIDAPVTKELLEQTAKVARLLARNNTHILMVGAAGERQMDCVYAAATMQQAKIQLLQGGCNYALIDFYNDLKLAMQVAALENQCTCLIIEHCWLSYVPDIMKPIEAILEESEILDLFGDDLESIASSLKHAAQLEGYQDTIGSYFMKRAQENLHLIICLDPMNCKIEEYFAKYPALYRNMDILYLRGTSVETFHMLPKKYVEVLSEFPGNVALKEKVPVSSYFSEILDNLLQQQASLRFYQLIKSYYYIYCNLSKDINKRLEKLQHGVDKLASAHAVVDTLKSNASKQEVALAEKRKLANEALEMISSTMRNANEQKSSMLELKKKTQVSSEKLKERQKEIQEELAEVEPILAEASAAVGQIKSEALSEIRSLRAPPETIRDILEGVLRLMGIRDTSWNSMKTFLAKRGVKEDIRSLDPARISPENCEAVVKLLANKADSFEMKNAKRASVAAAPLAAWVKASVRYSKVIQSIKPLEREQKELQKNLDVAEDEMQSLMTGLDDVDNRVKQLSAKLNAYTQEAAVLELKLEEARNTLTAAEVLVEQLSSEYQTWSMQLEEYNVTYKTLDTKSLLIALALNYYSHMSLKERSSSLNKLTTELQLKESFHLHKNLLTDQEQIIWESMGLARDAQIIENAAVLRQMLALPFGSYPTPLLLDPTETALNWLKEYLHSKERPFEVVSQNNQKLSYSLELAVRFGKIFIVEDCQEMRPPLMQLITNKVYMKFNKKQIEVGNKMVDLHDNFQLVLVTKTHKLSIEAETFAYISCIPFTVTAVGLSDQLMSKAIIMKNPELEQKRVELLKNEGVLLKQRLELEDKLLEELSLAQGDILKNEKLLKTLNEVKESSSIIDKSLKESSHIKSTLLADYTALRELCSKASLFYINLTSCYELSSIVFIKLFLNALELHDIGGHNSSAQIELKFYSQLVRECFQYLARSIQKDRHLSLALYVCRTAYKERIKDAEWELFVTNFMAGAEASSISSAGFGRTQFVETFGKEAALKLQVLINQKPDLEEKLQLHNFTIWSGFKEGKSSEIPVTTITSFEKLLISLIIRPDLVTHYMKLTAEEMLGISIESLQQPTIEQLVEESSAERPILMITQTENDPAAEILSVAVRTKGKDKYQEISIGKGMEKKAMEVIKLSAELGKWICVKNVHLVPYWLLELEREFGEVKKHPDFRLWLICESTQGFSEAVMYKFVKVLYEYPAGIKQKAKRMLQNYAAMEQDRSILKESKLMKIRVVLFIALSVIQERRRFIPQGWSQKYEFGEADLKAALQLMKWLDALMLGGRIDWQIMQKLNENVAFGGRINNLRDLLVLQKYLQEFFNNESLSSRWAPLEGRVTIPTSTQWSDYLNALAKLPAQDEPELFKLSKKSNVSREIDYGLEIMRELRVSYFGLGSDNEMNQQNLEKQIKPLLALWRKLAQNCSINVTAQEVSEDQKSSNPWLVFIHTELKLAGEGYQMIHNTLSQVYSSLKEQQNNSQHTENIEMINTLASNQVPLKWQRLWCGPTTALDYIKAFMHRASNTESRYRTMQHLDFIEEIDLTTVYNCQTLISALKLINSHKQQISSKNLTLESHSLTSEKTHHSNSAKQVQLKFKPLQVNGAVFSYGKLIITSNDVLTQEDKSPEFIITFREKDNRLNDLKTISRGSSAAISSTYLPVYTNAKREKLLCELEVATTETADTVLLSGAALIVGNF
ncbi:cytoplasmic dynein 2 heavy chain 1 [Calliphora vicina]|uniref:cytoplasmic dynein 2 heavy chain 1 n=1 Tax=Calliphora vicina TaxID=7373 RepID=UPI00325A7B44